MIYQVYRKVRVFCLVCCVALCTQQDLLAVGKKYALVVGVERYKPSQLTSLQYAEDDAIAVAKALTDLGFNVVTMTQQMPNPDHVPSSSGDILKQIKRRLRNRSVEDTIIVALSGHGVQLKSDSERADGTKESYFCPERAVLQDRSSLLAISQVVSAMQECKARKKLLLVDACRNEVAPQELAGKDASPLEEELDPAGVTRRTIPAGMLALFSCSPKERSFEFSNLKHSVFMYKVLEYLKGDAPSNRYPRSQLRIGELVTYVTRETRDLIDRRLGVDQNPELILPEGRLIDWELGRLSEEREQTIPSAGMVSEMPSTSESSIEVSGTAHGLVSTRVPKAPECSPEFLDAFTTFDPWRQKLASRWDKISKAHEALFLPGGPMSKGYIDKFEMLQVGASLEELAARRKFLRLSKTDSGYAAARVRFAKANEERLQAVQALITAKARQKEARLEVDSYRLEGGQLAASLRAFRKIAAVHNRKNSRDLVSPSGQELKFSRIVNVPAQSLTTVIVQFPATIQLTYGDYQAKQIEISSPTSISITSDFDLETSKLSKAEFQNGKFGFVMISSESAAVLREKVTIAHGAFRNFISADDGFIFNYEEEVLSPRGSTQGPTNELRFLAEVLPMSPMSPLTLGVDIYVHKEDSEWALDSFLRRLEIDQE